MAEISKTEIGAFLKLFNRGGYVLDFSTNDFDVFTLDSIGEALCEKYQMSKGKSLTAFISEAPYHKQIRLISDLFTYYEVNFADEYTTNDDGSPIYGNYRYNAEYAICYKKCKEIMSRISGDIITLPLAHNAEVLKTKFSSGYLSQQIDLMTRMQSENPTDAIGKDKELIESCCKTILDDESIEWDKNWDVGKLARETLKHLKLMPDNIPETVPAATEMKALLGHLRAIATSLATLRNPYGSGHGKSATYRGLEERHAKLAVGSSITFVSFLWDTHERRTSNEI